MGDKNEDASFGVFGENKEYPSLAITDIGNYVIGFEEQHNVY